MGRWNASTYEGAIDIFRHESAVANHILHRSGIGKASDPLQIISASAFCFDERW
jgi:hypothetical protein